MIHKKSKGFTLVELVVVATILAILGAVGFSAYTGYISGARDSNRIAQLENMRSGLQSIAITSTLPSPEDYIEVHHVGSLLGYQGYAGASVINTIGLKKGGKDPKDGSYFTYYLSKSKNSFQLMTYLENENSSQFGFSRSPFSASSYASDYYERFPLVTGEALGIIIGTGIYDNIPAQEIPTIKAATVLDIGSTIEAYTAIIKDDYSITGDAEELEVLDSLAKTKGTIGKSCKDLIDTNAGLLGEDGEYLISYDGTNFVTVLCEMTYDGGGWTRYTQKDSSGYFVYDLGDTIENFDQLFYAYKRDTDDMHAFKFTRFYTQQCGEEHGDVNNLKLGMRDYVDHIENASWGTCSRNSTDGDTNDIAIREIITGKYKKDACITGNLHKTSARNYSWQPISTSNGKTAGRHQHRISDHTILFGPEGNGSTRCASSSAGPSTSEVTIYLR